MGNKLEIIGHSAIRDSGSIILPSTVSFVSSSAFYSPDSNGINGTINMGACSKIKRVEYNTFGYNKITEVILPPNLEIIDNDAFYQCKSLSSITLPNSVKYIGDYAFAICHKLQNITIPSSVEYIGQDAFLDYPVNLTEGNLIRTVNVLCEIPPIIYWDNAIFGTPGIHNTHVYSLRINVPNTSLEKYKNAPGWSNYKNYIYGV